MTSQRLYEDGDTKVVNGKLHRDNDLPAIIWSNGCQNWYINNDGEVTPSQ